MTKEELERIRGYCVALEWQPVPHLALPIQARRDLQALIFKWAVENGIELPLGSRPHEVEARGG